MLHLGQNDEKAAATWNETPVPGAEAAAETGTVARLSNGWSLNTYPHARVRRGVVIHNIGINRGRKPSCFVSMLHVFRATHLKQG